MPNPVATMSAEQSAETRVRRRTSSLQEAKLMEMEKGERGGPGDAGGASASDAPAASQTTASAEQGCTESELSPDTSQDDNDDGMDNPASLMWVANYEQKKFQVKSLLPPVVWLPAYVRTVLGRATQADKDAMGHLTYSILGDAIAGLTVGFMLVPQCLAFALLAGLPVQVGLYASFLPLVVYALLGTIRQVQPGPTALMSLLTGSALDSMGLVSDEDRIKVAAMMALAVGLFSVLLGVIRFGFIVDFMSHSVMAAFCSAAGVTIATSQVKAVFGIEIKRQKYWWKTAWKLCEHSLEADPATAILGCSIFAALVLLKQWKSAGSAESRSKHPLWRWFPTRKDSRSFKAIKIIADLSSLGAVIVGWLWGYIYRQAGITSVKLVGAVDSNGLSFLAPGADLPESFDWSAVLQSAAIMAVVGFLETVAVGGKFAAQARYEYDPNQELLALGLSNVAGALTSGYPTTGSFSRTAVNAMLGASSLLACGLTSVIVIMAIYFLLPTIALLPMAALAPIIIQGAMGVINTHDFVVAWRSSPAEFGVMASTFMMSLALTVKEGLLVGFVLSVLKTMHDLANPNLAVCGRTEDNSFRDIRNFPSAELIARAVIVRMDARLSFANSRKMKDFCLRAVSVREQKGDKIDFLVVDGKSINHVDLTGCEMLDVLAESLHSQGRKLVLANLKGPVSKFLHSTGVPKAVRKHGGHLCIDMEQAIAIVNGADPTAASESMQELVRRVDSASRILKSQSGHLLSCGVSPGCASTATPGSRDDAGSYLHREPSSPSARVVGMPSSAASNSSI
eukprot:TRINITY_DN12648_c0_g1_i1.p1 TRINITY_DN12648_c0_g1~~TRINITY_DN12648_c0_g1_i1.p1  ORF type:complete len:794 (+),score=182.90 TRINITY_DN12648_c0_g1_i1:83-2464(+)